jgi:hypothetical protein
MFWLIGLQPATQKIYLIRLSNFWLVPQLFLSLHEEQFTEFNVSTINIRSSSGKNLININTKSKPIYLENLGKFSQCISIFVSFQSCEYTKKLEKLVIIFIIFQIFPWRRQQINHRIVWIQCNVNYI